MGSVANILYKFLDDLSYPCYFNPILSESFSLSHTHSLSLQKSYIPLIFASLPVILNLGLTFFLVGLIVFLFELNWPVAIPTAFLLRLHLCSSLPQLFILDCNYPLGHGRATIQPVFHPHTDPHSRFSYFA